MTLLEKILKYEIHIDWEKEIGDGPSVYCEGASSWKACISTDDLEAAIDHCIAEKEASKTGLEL